MVWQQPDFGKTTQEALTPAKVGVVDLFWAPRFSAYDALLTWKYLGRQKPGGFKQDGKRKFYDLLTGVPQTPKESFVIGLSGTAEAVFIEPTSDVLYLASGNAFREPIYSRLAVGPFATTVDAAPAPTTAEIDLTSAANFAEGDEIEVEYADGTKRYTRISDLTGTLAGVYPKLAVAPAAGDDVKKVLGWKFLEGGTTVERVALRAVFTATDGSQVVTLMPDVRSDGLSPDYKDGQTELEVPVNFTMFGRYNASVDGPVLAEKYLLTRAIALAFD